MGTIESLAVGPPLLAFLPQIGPTEMIVILGIGILLFGKRLPAEVFFLKLPGKNQRTDGSVQHENSRVQQLSKQVVSRRFD